ncbi:MAG: SAF domain-containing protein [Myxococcales bacterium]|nr:SAF domain-containing protein [Myxococcales bacterium]
MPPDRYQSATAIPKGLIALMATAIGLPALMFPMLLFAVGVRGAFFVGMWVSGALLVLAAALLVASAILPAPRGHRAERWLWRLSTASVVLAGVSTTLLLPGAADQRRADIAVEVQRVGVVMPSRDLPAGHRIEPHDLRQGPLTYRRYLNDDTVHDADDVMGMELTTSAVAGEILREGKLRPAEASDARPGTAVVPVPSTCVPSLDEAEVLAVDGPVTHTRVPLATAASWRERCSR